MRGKVSQWKCDGRIVRAEKTCGCEVGGSARVGDTGHAVSEKRVCDDLLPFNGRRYSRRSGHRTRGSRRPAYGACGCAPARPRSTWRSTTRAACAACMRCADHMTPSSVVAACSGNSAALAGVRAYERGWCLSTTTTTRAEDTQAGHSAAGTLGGGQGPRKAVRHAQGRSAGQEPIPRRGAGRAEGDARSQRSSRDRSRSWPESRLVHGPGLRARKGCR
jgi:hypothetical protein